VGWQAALLLEALRAIASHPWPQPPAYLAADVVRLHGHVKIASAGSCLISQDTALLAEICASRFVRALGLRLLAPTVASSQQDAKATLSALRAAGYMPMPHDAYPTLRAVDISEDDAAAGWDDDDDS